MQRVAVVGSNGKMGSLICSKLENEYEIVKIEKEDSLDKIKNIDLVIDFSSGENSAKSAKWCSKHGVPLIIGATGQTEAENKLIAECAKEVFILKAGNFSRGMVAVKNMLLNLKSEKIESITILEKHHAQKKDKPSGTALELADFIKKELNLVSDIVAIRGGKEIGLHEINVYLEDEVIKISHQAFSREAFVKGVVQAALEILKKI